MSLNHVERTEYTFTRRAILVCLCILSIFAAIVPRMMDAKNLLRLSGIFFRSDELIGPHGTLIRMEAAYQIPAYGAWIFPALLACIAQILLPSADGEDEERDTERIHVFCLTFLFSFLVGFFLALVGMGSSVHGWATDANYVGTFQTENVLLTAFICTCFYALFRAGLTARRLDWGGKMSREPDSVERAQVADVAFITGFTQIVALIDGIQTGFTLLVGIALTAALFKIPAWVWELLVDGFALNMDEFFDD